MRRLPIVGLLALAACTPGLELANVHKGVYGVICQTSAGLKGVQVNFDPVNSSPGVDLTVCDGSCVRPRIVAVSLAGEDLVFDTRDGLPAQDGVSVAPERHWTAAFEGEVLHIEGSGAGYALPSTSLSKGDETCPAGATAVEPRISLAS